MTDFSAATAPRVRSARRWGWREEVARGVPSHVTDDLAATEIALDHDELRERMSGNLCRCGAHNGIVDAIAEVYAGSGA